MAAPPRLDPATEPATTSDTSANSNTAPPEVSAVASISTSIPTIDEPAGMPAKAGPRPRSRWLEPRPSTDETV